MVSVIESLNRMEEDGQGFDVTVIEPDVATHRVLFAAGRGGNPARHRGLLEALAMEGARVIAPHFDMASPMPGGGELRERARRIRLSLARDQGSPWPVSGIGHSMGAVLLLMLAGATVSTITGEQLTGSLDVSFARLILLAPPTDFFRRPGALSSVRTPLQVWVGERDHITPPEQARFLQQTLQGQASCELRIVQDAGHFTFMNELPPGVSDSHPAREAFLRSLASEASRFLTPGAGRWG